MCYGGKGDGWYIGWGEDVMKRVVGYMLEALQTEEPCLEVFVIVSGI